MAFFDAITDFIFQEDAPQAAEYLFIPGSGCGELAIRAAGLYRAGLVPKIVASGRFSITREQFQGPLSPEGYVGKTYATECDFLADVLRAEGVPESAIVREGRAQYTYQNAIYTRQILTGEVRRAILVCKPYHARRCLLYYQLLFPETQIFVCPAATDVTRENWHLSEKGISLVLGELSRIGAQFGDILLRQAGLAPAVAVEAPGDSQGATGALAAAP